MNTRLVLAALILFLSPLAAFADLSLQPYASVNVGWANGNFPIEPPFNGLVDDGSLTYGVEVGLGFGDYWSAEFGLSGYNEFDGTANFCAPGPVCVPTISEQSVDQTLYDIGIARRFTIGRWRVFGKAGYYHANIDTKIPFADSDFNANGLMIGVGTRWYFQSPWNVSLEATRFDDNVTQFTVGIGWGRGFGLLPPRVER